MKRADIVQLFEEKRPVCMMAQMAIERLLCREEIDGLFHNTAQGQYERGLLFSSLAKLMSAVVLCRQKSVRASYRAVENEWGVSLNAVYTKLERVEPQLSQALVRYSYEQSKSLCNELRSYDESPVPGYAPKILDGNHLSATEHRLKETRQSTAAPLPGKSLVVLDPRREAIADLFPIEDGHAQERSALDEVIETIQRKELWIADRNFCTLKLLYSIHARGSKFVIRQHQQLEGALVGRRRFVRKIKGGRLYEQILELPAFEGRTLCVRRIEVELQEPTRDDDSVLMILTNLTEEEADAVCVAEVYRTRWRIETAFQKLTTTLQCELNTLCYPKAALFAFSLACLAYNAISMLLAVIRSEHGKEKTRELSFHYMSLEIAQAFDGMMVSIPEAHWDDIQKLSMKDFAARMREIARHINFEYFRKTKHNPRKPKPKPKHERRKVHVSTARILEARKHDSAC